MIVEAIVDNTENGGEIAKAGIKSVFELIPIHLRRAVRLGVKFLT